MLTIKTKSAEETKLFAQNFARKFKSGGVIALSGELGAGKTTFAQGFAKGLGVKEKIVSPTFLIIRQYQLPRQRFVFYHIDLYRLEKIDLVNSGLNEILEDPENIVLIEWSEKIERDLPKNAIRIRLKKINEDVHEIELTN